MQIGSQEFGALYKLDNMEIYFYRTPYEERFFDNPIEALKALAKSHELRALSFHNRCKGRSQAVESYNRIMKEIRNLETRQEVEL